VRFARLARRVRDDSGVPRTGHLDRIFASASEYGQGVDYGQGCIANLLVNHECTGRQVGRLQPYGLYVPRKPRPRAGFGLVISMHGLSANHNEFLGSNEAEQLGDRGRGSIVASPEGRGPDGSYKSSAEADVFEMWADVARHYRLDPDLTDISGYSMGGLGTYELASRWPDLFARAFPIVGPPSSQDSFRSLRNIPVMAWYGVPDELVGPEMSEAARLYAEQAGIRFDMWSFTPAGHITIGNNDEFAPAAAFLGDHRVDRDPAHVTYVVDPATPSARISRADHAYWLSSMRVRSGGSTGTIDVRSRAKGTGDPAVLPATLSLGTLNGGSHGPLPYARRTQAWGPVPATAKENRLDVAATNVAAVTVAPRRAGVRCDAQVAVRTDGPVRVTLAGCDRTVTAG
jgi:predicted esterase